QNHWIIAGGLHTGLPFPSEETYILNVSVINIQAACMQQRTVRRSNRERSDETREKLIEAARQLSVEKSYAETSTPEIVAAPGLTAAALSRQFGATQGIFKPVVEREAHRVAEKTERQAGRGPSPAEAPTLGGDAFLAAMAVPGRTRLLLLDGPAV